MIRHIALVLNFLLPGLGSLVLGKWRVGFAQLAILAVCILAISYSFHSFYFVVALAADWISGLIVAEWSPKTGAVAKRKA